MGSRGEIPGWGLGAAADPRVPGRAPDDSRIPDRLAEIWGTYRGRFRDVLSLAVVIQGTIGVVFAPLWVAQLWRVQQVTSGFGAFPSPSRADFAEAMRSISPLGDPLAVASLTREPSLAFLALLAMTGSMATLLLSPRDEDRTVAGSLRSVIARAPSIAVPVVLVAVGLTVLVGLEWLWIVSAGLSTGLWPGQDSGVEPDLRPFLLVAALAVTASVVFVYVIVRWALAIPALFIEGIGLRSSLGRSSELTRGRRLSVALTLIVVSFATGLVTSGAWYLSVYLLGPALDSAVGFALASLITLLALVVVAPFVPIALVLLYRDFSLAGPRGDQKGASTERR